MNDLLHIAVATLNISSRNMTFIEFKTSLYKEIKPLLEMLISLKTEKKKAITSYAEVESTVF